MSHACQILLLSQSPEKLAAWRAMLNDPLCHVRSEDADQTDDEPDLIVTDEFLVDDRLGAASSQVRHGQIGVVAVGDGGPADVSLPVDGTARELRLACLMLAQIVRLRREREESQRMRRVLTHLAYSDPLTGLPNRRAWERELDDALAAAATHPGCLAIIDLDRFKEVNERFGYVRGDELLREVARQLSNVVREQDLVARLGGDEFGVLCRDVPPQAMPGVIERIRSSLNAVVDPAGTATSASAGVSRLRPSTTASQLIHEADQALRTAKRAGGGRTAYFGDGARNAARADGDSGGHSDT